MRTAASPGDMFVYSACEPPVAMLPTYSQHVDKH